MTWKHWQHLVQRTVERRAMDMLVVQLNVQLIITTYKGCVYNFVPAATNISCSPIIAVRTVWSIVSFMGAIVWKVNQKDFKFIAGYTFKVIIFIFGLYCKAIFDAGNGMVQTFSYCSAVIAFCSSIYYVDCKRRVKYMYTTQLYVQFI